MKFRYVPVEEDPDLVKRVLEENGFTKLDGLVVLCVLNDAVKDIDVTSVTYKALFRKVFVETYHFSEPVIVIETNISKVKKILPPRKEDATSYIDAIALDLCGTA